MFFLGFLCSMAKDVTVSSVAIEDSGTVISRAGVRALRRAASWNKCFGCVDCGGHRVS